MKPRLKRKGHVNEFDFSGWTNICHLTTSSAVNDDRFLNVTDFFVSVTDDQWRLSSLMCPWPGQIAFKTHDVVIKWKHFPRYWPFVRGIHRSPVNSPHKGQWCGALMFSLICAWINAWADNREAGDLRRNRTHYDVIVMTHDFPLGLHLKNAISRLLEEQLLPKQPASFIHFVMSLVVASLCSPFDANFANVFWRSSPDAIVKTIGIDMKSGVLIILMKI